MTPRDEARRAMAITLGFDTAAAALAMAAALISRWLMTEGAPPEGYFAAIVTTAVFAGVGFISFYTLGVHKQVWRHSGWSDAVRIVQAVALATLIFMPIIFLWNRFAGIPRSALAMAVLLWLAIIFTGRMIALGRSTQRPFQIFFGRARPDAPMVLLIAQSEEAARIVSLMGKDAEGAKVRILGLLEPEGAEFGRKIRGIPVLGGLEEMGKVLDLLSLRYEKTPLVAVAGLARERPYMTQILEVAASRKTEVMSLSAGIDESAAMLPVRPADLLRRRERQLDTEPVADLIEGMRVFVTGGGGTIGSELARQCAGMNPHSLTLFDSSEYNLYEADLSLREQFPNLPINSELGDVRDNARVSRAIEQFEPDIIIHAAALKHVPLMEQNVCEAILTNVGGALITAKAAQSSNVQKFVFVSTDKAVHPDNVMGATKRLAELTVTRQAVASNFSVSMVRFGNVLGSSGSVVPLFERQIARGGPVTLTHPEVTRYFMTVEEASALVLQSATHNGSPGSASLYVLDMGEPVLIKALAEAMIRLKGLVPGQDIEIRTTGLRPGEKMHEKLTYNHEEVNSIGIEGVYKVASKQVVANDFDEKLDELLDHARHRRRDEAIKMLAELVPEYRPRRAAE
ncbi:nucleoside-diphosphate sugar epimerase/dehydratase [Henriciella marina]|uniref:nucleoside-diphosphate sugar epimerase/dehydratase n=1 Tax=Henriciella marina TaxID=453851 RepID=UPI0003644F2A|nr:nucleoside-diphosphate sugar epimerase/dehydratase [Henriciella marina]